MNSSHVVLASGSPWRRELLASTGLQVLGVESGVDESQICADDPIEVARQRAKAKASAVARGRADWLVIGADQVVHLNGRVFGKPTSDDDWIAMLQALRGHVHQLTTAVCMLHPDWSEWFDETSSVRVRDDVSDEELRTYVALGEASGCAGGYMVEGRGSWLVEHVSGDWNNVIGLPVGAIVSRLRRRGWRVPEQGETTDDLR